MLSSYRNAASFGAIVGSLALCAIAQQVEIAPRKTTSEKQEPAPKANIRVDSTLVLIPVTVTDPLNRFVTGLEKENFKIFEDKLEQQVKQFSSEDAPLSIGVLFDTSGSMGNKLAK